MAITLTVEGGPHKGQSFTFKERDRFLVGRSSRAHFRLRSEGGKDLHVSRQHFLIDVNPPLCRLYDAGSRGGTFVNGLRVQSQDLRDGDLIRAGHTTMRVRLVDEATVDHAPPDGHFYLPTIAPDNVFLHPTNPPGGGVCPACGKFAAPPGAFVCANCRPLADAHAQTLAGYLLLDVIGKGGMGRVHRAVSPTGRLVAVKRIHPEGSPHPSAVERFKREARVLAKLDHPHIVRFHDVGSSGGELYLAMEYVSGTDASRVLERSGRLPVPVAVGLIRQVLEALEHAHTRETHVVHRDIKPANILLEKEGGRIRRAKLADFGLARVYEESQLSGLTMMNDMGGTPGYLPPEQITNFREAKPAADQYSAAATLYHLLTGRQVYDMPARFSDLLPKILNEPPVPILARDPALPRDLADVIHKALSRRPSDRFPDARAFRKALRPFAPARRPGE